MQRPLVADVVLVSVVTDLEVTSAIGNHAVARRDRIVPGGEIKLEPASKRSGALIDSASPLVVLGRASRFRERMDHCEAGNFGIYRARRFGMAQVRWRAAARIVALRWEDFLRSDVDSRVFAFASYLAALDTEEAAAAQMSRLLPRAAECGTTG
jgi:hypothetical protein